MAERYFTPEEVERLIPGLTTSMERLRAAQEAGRESQTWLDAEQQRIFDLGEILVERLPRGCKLQQRRSPNRLDNQTVPFLAEKGFGTGQLQVARNPQCLVPPVPKQPYDPFGLHRLALTRRRRP